MENVAPLTYGQLSVLRYVQPIPESLSHEANLRVVSKLPPGLAVVDVLDGLAKLQEGHESLRTTYDIDAEDGPHQIVGPARPLPIEVVSLPGADPAGAVEVAQGLADRRFTLSDDLGWHGAVVTDAGRPRFVCIALHHMVADGWSVQRLAALIPASLATRSPSAGSDLTPRRLAMQQRSDAWAARRIAAMRQWRRLLADGPTSRLPAVGHSVGPEPSRIHATLELGRAGRLIDLVARRAGVLPQAVFVAGMALGICELGDTDECVIALMASNRQDPACRDVITSMNQHSPVRLRLDDDEVFTDFLRRVQGASLRAYQHGCYDVDEAARLTDGLGLGQPRMDFVFNYLARPSAAWVDPERTNSAPELGVPQWTPSSRRTGARFGLIVTGEENLTLEVSADSSTFPSEAVVRFLGRFADWLVMANDAAGISVGELRRHSG